MFLCSAEMHSRPPGPKGDLLDIVFCIVISLVFVLHEIAAISSGQGLQCFMGVLAFYASIYSSQTIIYGAGQVIRHLGRKNTPVGGTSNMQHGGNHAESGPGAMGHGEGKCDSQALEPLMQSDQGE
jgi:hypothetical protein